VSATTAAVLIYTCAIIALALLAGFWIAVCVWLMVGAHSLILVITLDRKGVIKL
jgi:hypothetical protein